MRKRNKICKNFQRISKSRKEIPIEFEINFIGIFRLEAGIS